MIEPFAVRQAKMKAQGDDSKKSVADDLNAFREESEKNPETIESISEMLLGDSISMYLLGVSQNSPLAMAPYEALQQYVQQFIESVAGHDCRENLLLRLKIERLLLLHHFTSRLMCDAVNTSDPQGKQANGQMAISFAAELRRLEVVLNNDLDRDKESRKTKGTTRQTAGEKMRSSGEAA